VDACAAATLLCPRSDWAVARSDQKCRALFLAGNPVADRISRNFFFCLSRCLLNILQLHLPSRSVFLASLSPPSSYLLFFPFCFFFSRALYYIRAARFHWNSLPAFTPPVPNFFLPPLITYHFSANCVDDEPTEGGLPMPSFLFCPSHAPPFSNHPSFLPFLPTLHVVRSPTSGAPAITRFFSLARRRWRAISRVFFFLKSPSPPRLESASRDFWKYLPCSAALHPPDFVYASDDGVLPFAPGSFFFHVLLC